MNKCSGLKSKVNIEKMSDKSRSAENIRSIFEPHVRGGSLLLFGALQLVCLQTRAEISWHLDPRSLLADSRFSQEHYGKRFHLKFVCSLVELQAGLTAHGCLSLQLLLEFLQNKLWAHTQANAAQFLPLASPGPVSGSQPPAHTGTHFLLMSCYICLALLPQNSVKTNSSLPCPFGDE